MGKAEDLKVRKPPLTFLAVTLQQLCSSSKSYCNYGDSGNLPPIATVGCSGVANQETMSLTLFVYVSSLPPSKFCVSVSLLANYNSYCTVQEILENVFSFFFSVIAASL